MSGISSVLLQNPGKCMAQTSLQPFAASAAASDPRSGLRYKICVWIRNLDGTANLTTGGRNGPKGSKRHGKTVLGGNFEAAGIEGAGCVACLQVWHHLA